MGGNTDLPPTTGAGGGGVSANGGGGGGLEAVGLRMSEGVNRALAGGIGGGEWKGRKGLARGSGKDLAAMVIR